MKILKFDEFINENAQITHINSKDELRNEIERIIGEDERVEGDTIDLNHLDVSRVKDMSCLFYPNEDGDDDWDDWDNWFHYFNFDISKWDVSNVANMDGMFYDCKYLNCDLSKWDVSNVTSMRSMFYGCEKFNGDLSRWDVSNVEDMDLMFYNCKSFKGNLDHWDVRNIKKRRLYDMFCGSLCKTPSWYHNE